LKDLGNIGVVESGKDLGLELKASQTIGSEGKRAQDLDGDFSMGVVLNASVDVSHATAAEEILDPKITDLFRSLAVRVLWAWYCEEFVPEISQLVVPKGGESDLVLKKRSELGAKLGRNVTSLQFLLPIRYGEIRELMIELSKLLVGFTLHLVGLVAFR
jgi:hypothetical protein